MLYGIMKNRLSTVTGLDQQTRLRTTASGHDVANHSQQECFLKLLCKWSIDWTSGLDW